MEQNNVFNVESVKKYLIEKINETDNFEVLYTIYLLVRRLLEQ